METNCSEENLGEWASTQKGMNFSLEDEVDSEKAAIPGMLSEDALKKLKHARIQIQEDDAISIDSGVSEFSNDGIRDAALRDRVPRFLYVTTQAENQYESREELRLAALKKPIKLLSSSSDDSRGSASDIKWTIQGLLLGHEVNLEGFRGLAEKKALLAKAIETNDGNAITAVILFLQQTLRASLFQLILMENKSAANHYVRYLETRSETGKLVDLLCMLGRTQDVLVLRYKTILRGTNLDRIQTQLSHFYASECSITDNDIAKMVMSHLHLVETYKALLQDKQNAFSPAEHPSVLSTLKYLSEHYYNEANLTQPLSPLKFRTTHNLTEKQYGWICLSALAKVQKWPQIESLLIKKGWMGSFQGYKCLLPPEDVCDILKTNGAPVDLISIFLPFIDNTEKKLDTAKRLKCHRIVIDIYAAKKDKKEIVSYKSKLEPKSKDYIYTESILKKMP